MSKISENLSRLEQEAQELVNKLKVLTEQIGSYGEAKDSLQNTHQRLESLIETAKSLTGESHSIISKFNEISGAGFIEQTKEINTNISKQKNGLTSEHKQLMAGIQAMVKKVTDFGEQINTSMNEISKKNQLVLIIIAVGVVVVVLLQIVQMFFMK